MKPVLKLLSYLGLALTVVPSFLVFYGKIPFEQHTTWMLAGTVLWFVAAPLAHRKPSTPA